MTRQGLNMTVQAIPNYLTQQMKDFKGFSYRNPFKFNAKEAQSFVKIEYDLLDLIYKEMGVEYKVTQQELVITKRNKVYDILLVKLSTKDSAAIKYYFDITQVFGHLR
jgi:hypothetical protein